MIGRLFSFLLTPLLIVGGLYAVARSCGLLLRSGSTYSFPSTFSVSVPSSDVPTLAIGIVALAVGIGFAFTLAHFLKWVPIVRSLILLVQVAALAVLAGVMVASTTY